MKYKFTLVLFFAFCFSLLIFNGCSSRQKKPTPGAEQNFIWNSRATIEDLIQKKTHNVNIQVFMKNEEKLRLEITGLMNYNIASILMDQNTTTYCIYPRKQCYSGASSEQTFRPLFSLTLHPTDFFKIPKNESLNKKNWDCSTPSSEKQICYHRNKNIVYSSSKDKLGGLNVEIKAPQFLMFWNFDPTQTEVQFEEKVFSLNIPKNYSHSILQ